MFFLGYLGHFSGYFLTGGKNRGYPLTWMIRAPLFYLSSMRHAFILSLALALSFGLANAQDSLVHWSDLTFAHESEKVAVRSALLANKPDYFTLFNYGSEATAQDRDRFYRFLAQLDLSKFDERKQDKQVKYVYENIHKTFLSKYEAINLFSEVWRKGYYNCVSATALYSIAFGHFGIPFVIKEKPNHVYPVAYPETRQVIVETTNPMVGSFAINQQFKQSYIENLRRQKLISNEEVATGNINTLFDKYFFKEEEDITLRQLVGVQYMNDGIFKLDEEKWLEAASQFDKAYLFYPSEKTANGLVASYLKAFQAMTDKDTIHARLLSRISRFSKYGISADVIKGEFAKVMQTLLFDQGKPEALETYYATLDRGLRQKEMKDEVSYVYHFERGRYYYNQGRYTDSQPYFEKALALRPNNQEIQGIFLALLERRLRTTSKAADAVALLEGALEKNHALKTNNNFNTLMASAYLGKFAEAFEDEKPTEGDKYRLLFEQQFGSNKDLNIDVYLIGQAYSTAAVYFFKKNQTSKAKIYIEKGLEFAPDNRELLMRKRALN